LKAAESLLNSFINVDKLGKQLINVGKNWSLFGF